MYLVEEERVRVSLAKDQHGKMSRLGEHSDSRQNSRGIPAKAPLILPRRTIEKTIFNHYFVDEKSEAPKM